MASGIKLRDLAAAKARTGATDRKASSTPLWKQKLQARTNVTPASKPAKEEIPLTASDITPEQTSAAVPEAQRPAEPTNPAAAQPAAVPELKLTIIQPPPLLPKPDLTRPEQPADRSALLRKLQELRAAGSNMLEAADTHPATSSTPGPSVEPKPAALAAGGSGGGGSTPPPKYLHLPQPLSGPCSPAPSLLSTPLLRGPAATPPHSAALGFPSLGLAATPVRTMQAHLGTPEAGAGAFGASSSAHVPVVSTPSLLGLRQQELKETGGGFLTHYADPKDLATPLPPHHSAHGGGGAGGKRAGATPGQWAAGATGGSTPLSVLRTIHRLQQLQRLQREGSQLVDALGGGGS